jgi:hypothetical protein
MHQTKCSHEVRYIVRAARPISCKSNIHCYDQITGYGSAQPYSEGYVSDYPYGYDWVMGVFYIGGGWGDEHYGRIAYGRGRDHGFWSPLAADGMDMVVKLGPAVATAVPDMAEVAVGATVNNLVLGEKDS